MTAAVREQYDAGAAGLPEDELRADMYGLLATLLRGEP